MALILTYKMSIDTISINTEAFFTFYQRQFSILHFDDNKNIYGMEEPSRNSSKAIGKFALENNIKSNSIQWKWQRWITKNNG
nr:hypothetical protein [Mycoplasmopsis bovis]